MNELEKKLTRRRELNGEMSGSRVNQHSANESVSSPLTSETMDALSSNSQPTQNGRIKPLIPIHHQTSSRASLELREKLAKRKLKNGETSSFCEGDSTDQSTETDGLVPITVVEEDCDDDDDDLVVSAGSKTLSHEVKQTESYSNENENLPLNMVNHSSQHYKSGTSFSSLDHPHCLHNGDAAFIAPQQVDMMVTDDKNRDIISENIENIELSEEKTCIFSCAVM
jgi:hypothetical protein